MHATDRRRGAASSADREAALAAAAAAAAAHLQASQPRLARHRPIPLGARELLRAVGAALGPQAAPAGRGRAAGEGLQPRPRAQTSMPRERRRRWPPMG